MNARHLPDFRGLAAGNGGPAVARGPIAAAGLATSADRAMDRYANGDEAAFEAVYDALAPRLMAFLRRQLRDERAAEDLLQQTLLHLVTGRASFLPGARVVPWAFAIARRLVIDAGRKNRRQVPIAVDADVVGSPLPSPAPWADQIFQARETAARAHAELSRMPEGLRVAFELVRLDGLSLADVAELLETSPNAVKVRVFRASEALRAALGDVSGDARRSARAP